MKSFLEKHHIWPNDPIIIACSGWADSMFLVSEIIKIHPKENIIIAHFNHELRGNESDRDEMFVRDFCQKKKLSFECGRADIKSLAKAQKLWLEETARNERYTFLETIRKKYSANYILTAHHLDDSIETFFFNLLRGTKLTGLSGIAEKNNHILRPLLRLQKKDILIACEKENIAFVIDSTNVEETMQRNYIRHSIVPLFEQINPSYPHALDKLMVYFSQIQKYLNSEILGLIHENSFLEKEYSQLPEFLRKELLRYIFSQTNNGTIGLTEGNLDEMERFVKNAKWGTIKEIKNLQLIKRQGKITFEKI